MLNKLQEKQIFLLWVIGILYILPLLIANVQYYDDIGRSIYGYFSWGIDGRPLSDLVFIALDIGSPATDIAPFPQLISILMLTTLCYFMHRYLNPDHRYGWLIFTPIFLSPFFIQNLAFRFDSITMSLSVIMAAMPLFFMSGGKGKLFLCSATCVLFSLCLYQASLSVFVATICLYVIFSVNKEYGTKNLIAETVIATTGMLIGYIIYSKIIVPIFVVSDYAGIYNHMIDSPDDLSSNILTTIGILKTFFVGPISKIFSCVVFFALLGLFLFITKVCRSPVGIGERSLRLLLVILSIVIIILCIPGPGLALKSMPIGPRVFIGFGFSISLLLSFISFISKRHQCKLNIIPAILIVVSFSYMATFCTATKSQEKLTEKIIDEVSMDMYKVGLENVKTITVDGTMLYTPVAMKSVMKYPLMRQMVPLYFDGNSAWGVVKMTELYVGPSQPSQDRQREIITNRCSMNKLSDNGLYRVFYKDGDMLISFSGEKCL